MSITDLFFNDPNYSIGFLKKMRTIMDEEQEWEEQNLANAEIVLIAYGISSRIAIEAIGFAKEKGLELGLIRPKVLWPFPRKAFSNVSSKNKALLTIEMNMMGQMREDVLHACQYKTPCYSYASARLVPDSEYVVKLAQDILAGKLKEEEVF